MRKKILWLLVTCLGVGLISYAILGFDSNTVSAELSQQAQGSFVRAEDNGKKLVVSMDGKETVYPISTNVWVYRNMQKSDLAQLKAGDKLEIILNSKDQAAYIKATVPEAQAGQKAQADAPSAAGTQPVQPAEQAGSTTTPAQPAPASSNGAAAAAAGVTTSTPPGTSGTASGANPSATGNTAGAAKAANWDKLSFAWKSRELMLEVKLGTGAKEDNELYLKRSDRSVIHLKGEAAAAMAQLFLKGLPADRNAYENTLKQNIAAEFQVKDTSPEWKMDVKWKEASPTAPASPAQASQPDPAGKAKGQDKDHDDAKEKEKDKGKGKEKSRKNDKEDKKDKGDHDGNSQ